jgi:hypothetical protein
MHKELIQWMRDTAHELVRTARPLEGETAGKLEAIAIDILQRALELEKADHL